MRKAIGLKPHLSIEEIKERLYHSRNGHHASYWQIILSLSNNPGKTTSEYCNYLGISDSKLYRIVSLYNGQGPNFCDALVWGGRREKRSLMSIAQEKQLLSGVFTEAIKGEILVAKHLRPLVEQKIGKPVSDDYLWDLLNRHDWNKKAPRPEHPKGHEKDIDAKREAFKKKCTGAFQQHPGR
jgi:transposase